MTDRIEFTTPPGRVVWGHLTDANETDATGAKLIYKSGPKQGQPRKTWDFGVAIPKGAGSQHWGHTDWGKLVWSVGVGVHADAWDRSLRGGFAWKIIDGDSTVPNKKGNKPCDQDGYAGCWVLSFSSEFPPSLFNGANGQLTPITQAGFINLGDFVQVRASVTPNTDQRNPGVFLNHSMVAFSGYGPRIIAKGRDPASAGFALGVVSGAAAAPVGGAATPPGSTSAPPPAGTASTAPPPAAAGAYSPPPAASPGAAAPPPSVGVTPNPAYAAGAPASAPPPPAAAIHKMTAKAQTTYEEYIKSGWTDAILIAHGMMEP